MKRNNFYFNGFTLLLLSFIIIFTFTSENDYKFFVIYSFLIAIASDIGGLAFGKFFKGRKLTKISPKKTFSGSIGAFIFSILLILFFHQTLANYLFIEIFLFTILVSFISQMGDYLFLT